MIVVDSCIIFDHTRGRDARLAEWFKSFPIVICGVVRAEVLHGVRTPNDRAKLVALLDIFPQLAMPENLWDTLGDNLAELRRNGTTVPFADVILATLAIHHDAELWTRDAHFQKMQHHLPNLKLFQEPASDAKQ